MLNLLCGTVCVVLCCHEEPLRLTCVSVFSPRLTNTVPGPGQKYIAQVLQDSSPEGEATESEEQGSQDEELINTDGMNDTDFQSCEDSLIENEIHQ